MVDKSDLAKTAGDEVTANPGETSDAPTDDVLEPTAGKGLPSYRPWDWIAGYVSAGVIIALMFAFAKSMYGLS